MMKGRAATGMRNRVFGRVGRRRIVSGFGAAALSFTVLTVLGGVPWAAAGTSPGPTVPDPSNPSQSLPCLPEQFPDAGTPRSDPPVPYEIPFTATLGPSADVPNLGGGYLEIHSPSSPFVVTMGGPVSLSAGGTYNGSIHASACGRLVLPNETGGIAGNPGYGNPLNTPCKQQTPPPAGCNFADQYNNNFVFEPKIAVAVGLPGLPGLPVLEGYASANGNLAAALALQPAANGGLNVEFESSAKSTAILNASALCSLTNASPLPLPPALESALQAVCSVSPNAPVPGGECTVALGDLRASGVPQADIDKGTSGPLGISTTDAETPAVLSTTQTAPAPLAGGPPAAGQPVTGPITHAQAVLVGNNFPIAAIDPNTPPAPSAPGANTSDPSTLCTQASLFNSLLGLPSPAGANTFYAPGTFAVYTSS